jgi:hypothetical protein
MILPLKKSTGAATTELLYSNVSRIEFEADIAFASE